MAIAALNLAMFRAWYSYYWKESRVPGHTLMLEPIPSALISALGYDILLFCIALYLRDVRRAGPIHWYEVGRIFGLIIGISASALGLVPLLLAWRRT